MNNNAKNNVRSDEIPVSVLIFKLLLFLALSAAAFLLCLSLVCEVTFDYTTPVLPTTLSADSQIQPFDSVNESDATSHVEYIPALYSFNAPIPESEAVEYDYFNDTVFIGDSRIKGLLKHTPLTPYDFSAVGLNVSSIRTKAYIRLPDEDGNLASYTLIDALTRDDVKYKSIYIATGLNELGWPVNGFIKELSELIAAIREITDVPIYLQLILPVTTESSETSPYGITNEKCFIFNDRLITLAEELEVFLLDPRELFALEDGTLDPAHSSDGVHLNGASCTILADYYRTHTVDITAYDNTKPEPSEDGDGADNIFTEEDIAE